ncbi:MAG: SGNH/GDSL hydrolase family protein [Candidatus Saccharimonadales bacterium]
MRKIICIITLVATVAVASLSASVSAATTTTTPSYLRYDKATYRQIQADLKNSKAKGNNRYTFIKVGDSNTENHMSLYGLGCYRYTPVGLRSSLEQVVQRYRQTKLPLGDPNSMSQTCNTGATANSFSRVSYAARGGATASYALTPGTSANIPCSDTTLVCEIKAVNPRYAFIQFGTNEARLSSGASMTTAELNTMQQQLTQMIYTARSYGVTPVLFTAPIAKDGTTGMNRSNGANRVIQINRMIRTTAKANRTPMIDLWFAQKQTIGASNNYGLKNDGIHLATSPSVDPWVGSVNLSTQNRSKYGMNLRNYLVLDSLEKLDRIPAKK